MRETWKVDTNDVVITPKMLQADPDKFGGLSLHMIASIQKGIVTIPLVCGCTHVGIPVDAETADRIIIDCGITIESEEYWCNICSPKVKKFFKDSDEEIPIITTFLTA